MPKVSPRGPNPIDVHVGSRVRLRRQLMKMSQEKLGDELGVTFQQVQKYERGANRIGSSRLFDLSRVLDVPVSFFFDDMPAEIADSSAHTGNDYDFTCVVHLRSPLIITVADPRRTRRKPLISEAQGHERCRFI